MSNLTTLYVNNDTVLELRGLRDEVSGTFLNAATVTATLYDSEGNAVSGQSWPKTLDYVAGSDGDYRVTVTHSMALTASHKYTARITADGGSGLYAQFSVPCQARARE